MNKINVLIIDDEPNEAILTVRRLERGGREVHWARVETESGMRAALSDSPWDIVLSDHVMPQFDAFSALNLLHEMDISIPFVIVSGRIGEETAVELMRAGAVHYVSKDNISRINTVVNHVLSDSHEHQVSQQQEQTLLAASRMEVTRTLAGGLSHEFNNLMVGVVTTSGILLQRDNEPDDNRKLLEIIQESGERAVQISRQLLAYAQGGQYNVSLISTSSIVEKCLDKLNTSLTENITISCDLQVNLSRTEGDKAQLVQLIDGLLHNAVESMPSGGKISIESFEHEQKHQDDHLEKGKYIGIKVTDTGVGIEPDKLTHVFEPFYTTKFLGRGLGLAAAWGITHNHHGSIHAESKVGEGSSFTVLLPAKEDYQEIIAQARQRKTCTLKKSILLIEDNEIVTSVTSTLLRHWGHHVLVAKDAKQALEQANKYADSIDMMVLDLGLPDRSGGDILMSLREAVAGVPILIVSGYPADDKIDSLLESSDTLFLRKPFSPSEISEKMHQLFEAQSQASSSQP